MLLTREEKERFTKWLKITAKNCLGIASEMENLSSKVMNIMIQREKQKAEACAIIIEHMSGYEEVKEDDKD